MFQRKSCKSRLIVILRMNPSFYVSGKSDWDFYQLTATVDVRDNVEIRGMMLNLGVQVYKTM